MNDEKIKNEPKPVVEIGFSQELRIIDGIASRVKWEMVHLLLKAVWVALMVGVIFKLGVNWADEREASC